jgi:alkyl hydroperoxide reductase subunit AhpF
LHAQKFGVRFKLAAKAVSLSSDSGVHQVRFDDGEVVIAKSVILATGARWPGQPRSQQDDESFTVRRSWRLHRVTAAATARARR